MDASLQERRLRVTRRLELTLRNTSSIINDINTRLERIIDSNRVLEDTADIYEIWSRKSV